MAFLDLFNILNQNLLDAIKKALNQELPATISIPHADKSTDSGQLCKKGEHNVDNCSAFFRKTLSEDLPNTRVAERGM